MRNYILKYIWLIIKHKFYVAKYCFIAKLYWRGIWHDMSKFSPKEFLKAAKMYCKENCEVTKELKHCWLYHKGRNDHHYEFWIDIHDDEIEKFEMPYKPFVEMICDWFAENKVYDDGTPLSEVQYWYYSERPGTVMNIKTMKKVDAVMEFLEKSNSFEETCKNLKRIYYEKV